MEFDIEIHIEHKTYRMHVKRIHESDSIEKFEVSGGQRSIVLRNNRPELKRQAGSKKPRWQIEEGKAPASPQAYALTVLAIEKKIEEIENPSKRFSP